MKRNIFIERIKEPLTEKKPIEIVERKGIGHPDTICDEICERVSRRLCKEYIKKFGKILHHNIDKALLVAGKSIPKFKGGKIIKKIRIIICGRATTRVGKTKINIKNIVKEEAKNYLKNFHALKEKDYKIECAIEEGSDNLKEVFSSEKLKANDTSFGIGYAPYSKLESIVLKIANFLNSKNTIKKYPWIGEDIKVMGLKKDGKLIITCSIAFIDKYINNIEDYFNKKEFLGKELLKLFKCDEIIINALDKSVEKAKCESDIYLTTTGLSAEMGDDGQVGRGNRVNGLITADRYMSMEAAAGKNPTNHVGKIYNVLANIIASDLVSKKLVKECYVKILSRIGSPIDEPQILVIQVKERFVNSRRIKNIANYWLDNIQSVINGIINGKFKIC
ncbi:MAG: methionine adenosyltransferase [Candidatus Pacearchaeota archaeon]